MGRYKPNKSNTKIGRLERLVRYIGQNVFIRSSAQAANSRSAVQRPNGAVNLYSYIKQLLEDPTEVVDIIIPENALTTKRGSESFVGNPRQLDIDLVEAIKKAITYMRNSSTPDAIPKWFKNLWIPLNSSLTKAIYPYTKNVDKHNRVDRATERFNNGLNLKDNLLELIKTCFPCDLAAFYTSQTLAGLPTYDDREVIEFTQDSFGSNPIRVIEWKEWVNIPNIFVNTDPDTYRTDEYPNVSEGFTTYHYRNTTESATLAQENRIKLEMSVEDFLGCEDKYTRIYSSTSLPLKDWSGDSLKPSVTETTASISATVHCQNVVVYTLNTTQNKLAFASNIRFRGDLISTETKININGVPATVLGGISLINNIGAFILTGVNAGDTLDVTMIVYTTRCPGGLILNFSNVL